MANRITVVVIGLSDSRSHFVAKHFWSHKYPYQHTLCEEHHSPLQCTSSRGVELRKERKTKVYTFLIGSMHWTCTLYVAVLSLIRPLRASGVWVSCFIRKWLDLSMSLIEQPLSCIEIYMCRRMDELARSRSNGLRSFSQNGGRRGKDTRDTLRYILRNQKQNPKRKKKSPFWETGRKSHPFNSF